MGLNVNKIENSLNDLFISEGPAVPLASAKLRFYSCYGNHLV